MQPQENNHTSGPEKTTGKEAGVENDLILVVDDSATVLRHQVDGYIGKSHDPEKLVRKVGEALAGTRTRCTAA